MDRAAAAYEACVKLALDWRQAHFNLGLCYRRLDRLKEAGEEYRRCLQLDPADVSAYNNLANVYELLGRLDDAETMYRLGLAASPKDATVRFNLAGLLLSLGKTTEAQGIFEELLGAETLPEGMDVPLMRLRLAGCYLLAHEEAKATEALDRVVEGAKDALVLREAARHFFNMKRYERARTVLEQAYQASQGDPETAYLLSLFFVRVADEKLRDLDKAVIYGDFAATARPNEPRYVSALAEVAHARGEKEKAVELVERALGLAPDSAALKAQLEEYRKDMGGKEEKTTTPEKPAEVRPGN
jgi:Flp pilus assembly protein TadD